LIRNDPPPPLHVRTPPISQLPTPPPHLLFLLSAGLWVAVGAATDPYYHPLVLPRYQPALPAPPMPALWCPAALDLVVLLRSYLHPPPPPPPLLHSTRLRAAAGIKINPHVASGQENIDSGKAAGGCPPHVPPTTPVHGDFDAGRAGLWFRRRRPPWLGPLGGAGGGRVRRGGGWARRKRIFFVATSPRR
jgi:hypothetical protein